MKPYTNQLHYFIRINSDALAIGIYSHEHLVYNQPTHRKECLYIKTTTIAAHALVEQELQRPIGEYAKKYVS